MEDYKLRDLRASHTLLEDVAGITIFLFFSFPLRFARRGKQSCCSRRFSGLNVDRSESQRRADSWWSACP